MTADGGDAPPLPTETCRGYRLIERAMVVFIGFLVFKFVRGIMYTAGMLSLEEGDKVTVASTNVLVLSGDPIDIITSAAPLVFAAAVLVFWVSGVVRLKKGMAGLSGDEAQRHADAVTMGRVIIFAFAVLTFLTSFLYDQVRGIHEESALIDPLLSLTPDTTTLAREKALMVGSQFSKAIGAVICIIGLRALVEHVIPPALHERLSHIVTATVTIASLAFLITSAFIGTAERFSMVDETKYVLDLCMVPIVIPFYFLWRMYGDVCGAEDVGRADG